MRCTFSFARDHNIAHVWGVLWCACVRVCASGVRACARRMRRCAGQRSEIYGCGLDPGRHRHFLSTPSLLTTATGLSELTDVHAHWHAYALLAVDLTRFGLSLTASQHPFRKNLNGSVHTCVCVCVCVCVRARMRACCWTGHITFLFIY